MSLECGEEAQAIKFIKILLSIYFLVLRIVRHK